MWSAPENSDAITVVSDTGEEWSPNRAPDKTAPHIPTVIFISPVIE